MNFRLLPMCLFWFVTASYAQTKEILDQSLIGYYSWTNAVFLEPCTDTGNTLIGSGSDLVVSKSGQRFQLLEVMDGGDVIIQILDYTKAIKEDASKKMLGANPDFYKYNFNGSPTDYSNLTAEDVNARKYGINQLYFKVSVVYIQQYARRESKIGGSLSAGIVNYPFRYRPQKSANDFSGVFSYGVGLGFNLGHKDYRRFTHSVLAGYSISSVPLDSSSINRNKTLLSSTSIAPAFSLSLGYMIEYQKIQIGIFIGMDRLTKMNHSEFDWQYQGKPWVSLGLGFGIFSGGKEKKDDGISQQN